MRAGFDSPGRKCVASSSSVAVVALSYQLSEPVNQSLWQGPLGPLRLAALSHSAKAMAVRRSFSEGGRAALHPRDWFTSSQVSNGPAGAECEAEALIADSSQEVISCATSV